MRIAVGLLAGLVAALAAICAVWLVGHMIYPVPSDIVLEDRERVGAYVRIMPVGAQLFVVAAWFLGAVAGGLVAELVAGRHWTLWSIVALVAAIGIVNVFWVPHPELLQIASVAAPLLGGLVASRLLRRRPPPAAARA